MDNYDGYFGGPGKYIHIYIYIYTVIILDIYMCT